MNNPDIRFTRETEQESRAILEREETEQVDRRFRISGIPPKFRKTTRDEFFPPPIVPVGSWEGGWFFTGPAGTGKTMLAAILAREKLEEGKQVRFISVPEFLVKITKTFKGRGPDADEIIDAYAFCDYLVLDDLGAERASDWAIEHLYLLLDKREKEMTENIIITSNLTLDEIAQRVSDRIPSRIAGLTRTIKFSGPDRRLRR